MTVIAHESVIKLIGDCAVEDAETLLGLLRAAPHLPVDLTQALWLHSAVFQVIYLSGAVAIGPAGEDFLAVWLWPLLRHAPPP